MSDRLSHYAAEYAKAGRPGEPRWLADLRANALDAFMTAGFPTTKQEEWRFTSVAPIAAEAFALGNGHAPDASLVQSVRLSDARATELVFVNGRFAPALSTAAGAPGVRAASLASARETDDVVRTHLNRLADVRQPFAALNTAFLHDGAAVVVPPRTVVEAPIHLVFLSTGSAEGRPTMSHPRLIVVVGDGSQVTLVETYGGTAGRRYLTNGITELFAGDGAVVHHYKRQYESESSFHVGAMFVRAGRGAQVASHSIAFGGSLVRNDVVAVLDVEGADCTLYGLYVADAARLVDNHTTIDHASPHCGSREMYKGILAGRARGVFNGKVIVRPDAQKTDAKQTNRALLLSEDAQINTKPQLEIFANDVKCTHGAAVGQLDDEAVFYLRSRGLGAPEARRLLIHAFAAEVLGRMPLAVVRTEAEAALLRQLSGMLAAQ
jgi:Fe-S cluster assembly protein SufD